VTSVRSIQSFCAQPIKNTTEIPRSSLARSLTFSSYPRASARRRFGPRERVYPMERHQAVLATQRICPLLSSPLTVSSPLVVPRGVLKLNTSPDVVRAILAHLGLAPAPDGPGPAPAPARSHRGHRGTPPATRRASQSVSRSTPGRPPDPDRRAQRPASFSKPGHQAAL